MNFNLRATLQSLAEDAQYITGATGAAIAVLRNEEMVCCATAGITAPPLGSQVELSSSFSGESVRRDQLLRCDSVDSDTRVDAESCRQLGIASLVVMPLHAGGRVAGLFQILSMQPHAFQERDMSAMKRIGAMLDAMLPTLTEHDVAPPVQGRGEGPPKPRRWLRTPIGVPISVTTLRSGVPEEIPGRTRDVCEKGMGLILAGHLQPGEGAIVEFLLPFATQSIRRRSVVRHQDGLRHGLEFVDEMAEQSPLQREVRTPLFMLPKILAGHQ
jgi:putative methionine-R-sulfoxide reductase with GAF domain